LEFSARERVRAVISRQGRVDGPCRAEGRDPLGSLGHVRHDLGGAAAALTGLLFVAVSIRITSVAQSQELRNRAAQTLSLFGTVLIISVLLAIPGQAYRTLDAELVVLAVIAGAGLYALDRRAKGGRSDQAVAPVLMLFLLTGYLRGRAKTQVALRNRLPRSAV
jgi:hypothetical protein